MLGVLFAERAILFENQSVGIVSLIFNGIVVSMLAFGAFERYFGSRCFNCHIENSITKKLHPSSGA